MNKFAVLITLIPLLLIESSALALTGPTPYITSVITDKVDSGDKFRYRAYVNWQVVTGVTDVDIPVGIDGYIGFVLCGSFAESYASTCMGYKAKKVTSGMTWRQAAALLTGGASSGLNTRPGEASYYSADLCGGVGLTSESMYIHSIPKWFPGTSCIFASPETYSCTQKLSSNTLNFGSVSFSDIDRTTGKITLTTDCNANGTVTIEPAWGGGNINMTTPSGQKGIDLAVYFDDKLMTSGSEETYISKKGAMTHNLTFKLSRAQGETISGEYSANAVFIFNYK